MTTEAQKKAQKKYDASNIMTISMRLNRVHDADIIEFLNSCENRQGTIKAIIREYIKTHS